MKISGNTHSTAYIRIDTRKCTACFKCVAACRERVIGKVRFLWHKHAVIRDADRCIGCFKCMRVCEYGAISKT